MMQQQQQQQQQQWQVPACHPLWLSVDLGTDWQVPAA